MIKILVSSAKGGVGKTTTTAYLAKALRNAGYKVGVMDADISAPNLPFAFGFKPGDRKPMEVDNYLLKPHEKDGVKIVSYWFDTKNGIPFLLWAYDRTMNILRAFCERVNWGDIDVLIIDCPPTSSDELIGLLQFLGHIDGAILILQGNTVSSVEDAKIAKYTFNHYNVPVMGFIQNMTSEFFNSPDVDVEAEIGVPKIAEVPLTKDLESKYSEYYKPVIDFLVSKKLLRPQEKTDIKKIKEILKKTSKVVKEIPEVKPATDGTKQDTGSKQEPEPEPKPKTKSKKIKKSKSRKSKR